MFHFLRGILTAFAQLFDLRRSAVDLVLDFLAGFIANNRVLALIRAEIAAVTVNNRFFSG